MASTRKACLPSADSVGTCSKKAMSSSSAMTNPLVPAKAATQSQSPLNLRIPLRIPACAGMGGASRCSRHQLVAAGFRHQDRRHGGVLLHLLPQPVNMRFQRVGGDAGIVAPYFLQKRLARHRLLPSAIKIAQDGGFL